MWDRIATYILKNRTVFEQWIAQYGSDKIILGADATNEKVAVSGWLEESKEDVIPFIKGYQKKSIQYVICTDISKDGMLEGPSFDLYKEIIDECSNSSSGNSATFNFVTRDLIVSKS